LNDQVVDSTKLGKSQRNFDLPCAVSKVMSYSL